ncbi:MAG: cytochrome-c oxidase, cbb3-type subunit III [Pseudomonadales bacterium]|nr:cytochrome-c oxidase, cbb3-type subunit III [Pseudomonadales bacterium]
MSTGISWFVIIGTLGSILGFFLLLFMNRKISRPGQTTGHSYDGIEEYDNPLPAWWYWAFILSMVFGLGYLAYYPGLGNFAGLSGWTQVKDLEEDRAAAAEKYGPIFAQYREVPIDELAKNPDVVKIGRRLFTTNCSVCHGATGQGSFGFPNLTDSEWMWGGSNEAIEETITNGRNGVMTPFGSILGEKGVSEAASYVMSLSGREVDPEEAAKGKVHFQTYCFVCHGMDAKGQAMFGAPNLTNEIWLYGNSRLRIEYTIKNGRNNQMPSFKDKLSADKIHILAAYVKSLGANK